MRPKDYKAGQDTGWEMREKFLENGYLCKVLEARNTREYKEGAFKDIICAEYYLGGYDEVFACHFGRGSSLGAAKYKSWGKFLSLPIINQIVRKMKGYKEKVEWLNVCKDVIKYEIERRV